MEIKKCPFCGGQAQVVVSRNFGIVYTVECHNEIECPLHYIRTKSFYKKAEAIKAWNRRVDDED